MIPRTIRLLLGAVAGVAIAAAVAVPASAATYTVTITGMVTCSDTSKPVVGVWTENYDGTDGFASWTAAPGKKNVAQYSFTSKSTRTDPRWRLDVGCGGTPQSWQKGLKTPDFRATNGTTHNRFCDTSRPSGTVACQPAARAAVTSGNGGYAGYCTWGAYSKWRDFTGYYPLIGGNANAMDDNAKRNGFTVTTVPHANSMVVFNTSGFGHVGWVTAVRVTPSGVTFDYVDMNGGSRWVNKDAGITDMFNKWGYKSGKAWSAEQAFIVAPD